jgi:pectate lyase
MLRPVRNDPFRLALVASAVALVALGCSADSSDGAKSGSGGGAGTAQGGTAGTVAGGQGGTPTGGASTGGATTGGTATGGSATGGAATGGSATGGMSGGGGAMNGGGGGASGAGSGGMPIGGAGAGGRASGGAGSGGKATGGAGSGGKATGGAGSGGSGGSTGCMTPPPPSTLIGWATQGGGTTGGGNETPVVVTTAAQFTSAIGGTTAAVIHLNGNINGSFAIGSNKTIIGVCGATITGDVHLNRSQNVILRNLKVVGRNCQDSPSDCSNGEDAISVNGGAQRLWFDHLDVSDGSDGNLDVTQGSDFVTISWTKFSYSSMRTDPDAGSSGHRFSNLVGASDTDASDVGHLNVTFHHNWWAQNVNQRMPRTRRGQIHVLNNLFTASGNSYCTNSGQDAKLLVENNVYSGVAGPLQVTENGQLRSVGNVFMNTSGNTNVNVGSAFTPPYQYTADPTSGLEAAIRSGAGPH